MHYSTVFSSELQKYQQKLLKMAIGGGMSCGAGDPAGHVRAPKVSPNAPAHPLQLMRRLGQIIMDLLLLALLPIK